MGSLARNVTNRPRNATRPGVTAKSGPKITAASQREHDPIAIERGPEERFGLYRLCPCKGCGGDGKREIDGKKMKCKDCRGEGRTLEEVLSCPTEAAVGVALVTGAREGEWADCPFGLLDREGEIGKKWLVNPWQPSPRNVRDAARVLANARKGEK